MSLPSLSAHLGMEQIFTQYNMVVEGVNQHATDSIQFHNETRRLYQEIRHLNSQVKAWTRLLMLGSIQTIPNNSVFELQIERQRINNALRSVADQVESRRVSSLLQRHCQDHQQHLAPVGTGFRFPLPNSSHPASSPNYYPPPTPPRQDQRQSQNMRMALPPAGNGFTNHRGHGGSVASSSSANSSNAENHPPPPAPNSSPSYGFAGFSNGHPTIGFYPINMTNGYVQDGSYISDSDSSVSSNYYPGN